MNLKLGIYRHNKKGQEYQVVGVAKHSETLEELVVYKPLYQNSTSMLWVRPLSMFTETVALEGISVPRFEFVREI